MVARSAALGVTVLAILLAANVEHFAAAIHLDSCFPEGGHWSLEGCCHAAFGPEGNSKCWAPPDYTYSKCCRPVAVCNAGKAIFDTFGLAVGSTGSNPGAVFPAPFECHESGRKPAGVTLCEPGAGTLACRGPYLANEEIMDLGESFVEVGGREGFWLQKLALACPATRFFSLEPFPSMHTAAARRLRACCPNAQVMPYGLGDSAATAEVAGPYNQLETIEIRETLPVLESILAQTGDRLDYLWVNCEGCEYSVLKMLLEPQGLEVLRRIGHLVVAWHRATWAFPSDEGRRLTRCEIERRLAASGASLDLVVPAECVQSWLINP
mmetsp:Transcript_68849/g.201607  ORF Transcript_68849/g.201607 Transcript_68849/m.201607 type:complete len:324 (-) Transcript_68849:65-1036(-)